MVILQAGDNRENILLNNFKLNILNSYKTLNFPIKLLVSSFRTLILNTLEHLILQKTYPTRILNLFKITFSLTL